MRYDSDLDLLLDFDAAELPAAWTFVETVCARANIEPDIHDRATCKPEFVKRVVGAGLMLA